MHSSKFKLLCLAATSFLLASTLQVSLPSDSASGILRLTAAADARSSGGRAGGGSFRRSSPSRSSSSPSRSSGGGYRPSYPSQGGGGYYRGGGGTVVVPVPVPGGPPVYRDTYPRSPGYPSSSGAYSTGSSNSFLGLIFALLAFGLPLGLVLWVAYNLLRSRKGGGYGGGVGRGGELENDVVTVTKIQVALLAQARYIQEDLTKLATEIDTSTPQGIQQFLQEAVLSLLRAPENWSHVSTSSQTVKNLAEAEALFNKLSIAERSKFSVETLSNVGGKISRKQDFRPDPDEGPASYIVVTLLLGTAHDKPMIGAIHNSTELQDALQQLAALPPDYLMVFEVLWSPQDPSDSLTYDELLTEYSDMVQL